MVEVDNELAKRAVELIEQDAAGSAESFYTFDAFFRQHSLYHGNEKRLGSGEVFICCPFHPEKTPSLAVNERKRVWNCLGCGKGGRYIDFLVEYANCVEGSGCTWHQKINELVAGDPALQNKLRAATIYRKKHVSAREFKKVQRKRFKYRQERPKTFLELATLMKKQKCTVEQIKFAILLMQADLDVDTVFSQVFGDSGSGKLSDGTKSGYDINKIMEGSDGV